MGCHSFLQGNLPHPAIEPRSPAFCTIRTPGKPSYLQTCCLLACEEVGKLSPGTKAKLAFLVGWGKGKPPKVWKQRLSSACFGDKLRADWKQRGQLEMEWWFAESPGNLIGSAVGYMCLAISVTSARSSRIPCLSGISLWANKSCSKMAGESTSVKETNILVC